MKNIKINGYNNLPLNCYLYEPSTKPKAVIQIIHGMQEHALRYDHFAQFLASNGFVVLASDSRGHGKTAETIDKLGYNDGDIFKETIEDQLIITKYLKEKYNLPIYIFGHSYGSFLTQKLVQISEIPEKFILCGTGNGSSLMIGLGSFVANLLYYLGLKNKKATLIENLSLKGYGKKFKNGNWLSRNDKLYENYEKDPYCGTSFPISFYKHFFSACRKLNKGIKNIPSAKKILFVAGDQDPVGENGKQVKKVYEKYLKRGKNASLKLYKDCRHELINELNNEEIYNDILTFYNN